MTPFYPAVNLVCFAIFVDPWLDSKERMLMFYVLAIHRIEKTFAKRDVMNGIQQIGFANAVITANANDPFIETKWTGAVVFELGDWYGM